MFSDQAAEKCAIDAPRHIVPRRNREERPRVVVESDRVVEPCRFGGQLAETHHALRTVMKPPRRSEAQAGIMSGERGQFTADGGLVKHEQNDGEVLFVAEAIEQRPQRMY